MNGSQIPSVSIRPADRWTTLGLRWNPFRVLEPEELMEVFVDSRWIWGYPLEQIAQLDRPLTEFYAPEGVGKTTLLRVLEQEWKTQGRHVAYVYLPREGHAPLRWDAFAEQGVDLVIIDEAQRLRPTERFAATRWVRQADRHLVTGTHRHWRTSGLPVARYRARRPSASFVVDFFQKRLTYAGDSGRFQLALSAAEWLVRRGLTGRVIEQALYELLQDWPAADDPPPYTVDIDRLAPYFPTRRKIRFRFRLGLS